MKQKLDEKNLSKNYSALVTKLKILYHSPQIIKFIWLAKVTASSFNLSTQAHARKKAGTLSCFGDELAHERMHIQFFQISTIGSWANPVSVPQRKLWPR